MHPANASTHGQPPRRGQCPPEHGQRPGPANAPDTATRREKKKKANAPPATPSMLVQYPYKKLRQKTNTCRSPLVCPGKEKKQKQKISMARRPSTNPFPGQTKPKQKRGGRQNPSYPTTTKNCSSFLIHPSIHPCNPGRKNTPPSHSAPSAKSPVHPPFNNMAAILLLCSVSCLWSYDPSILTPSAWQTALVMAKTPQSYPFDCRGALY